MAGLKCKNLTLGYEHDILVKDLNFEVNKGDYLCVVGENGAGKSTLMRTILNLQKPLSGDVIYEGLKSTEIGYLPQQTVVQKDFPASVIEVVLSGCQSNMGWKPFYSKKDKEMAAKAMDLLDISDMTKRCYRELSGGQQQRVLLARALCATEKMLLLDEPASGLDPKVATAMYDVIKELNDKGITVIMISHDIAAAVKYADLILHIGADTFYGTTEEYKNSDIGRSYIERGEANA